MNKNLKKEEVGQISNIIGSIMNIRSMTSVVFFDIYTSQYITQCLYKKINKVDIYNITKGDIIKAEGVIVITNTGDIAIEISHLEIMQRSEILIPDNWTGVEDNLNNLAIKDNTNESLYLLTNGHKVLAPYRTLIKIEQGMRQFLLNKNFEEVKTSILQGVASGAMARPFITHHNFLDRQIEFRIAPEIMLKKLLIAGFSQIFEIGQCFRNEGSSVAHLQEFTMLECYQTCTNDYDAEYIKWQQFSKELIAYIITQIPNAHISIEQIMNMPKISYSDLLLQYIGYDLTSLWNDDQLLHNLCIKNNIIPENYPTKDDKIERLYKLHARPYLIDPILIYDYPVMPLAKSHNDNLCSYQFQILIDTHEVLKACIEEDSLVEQNNKFKDQDSKKDILNGEVAQSDDSFLECMKLGMPPTCGLGIVLNRLAQILTKTHNIRDTVMLGL